MASEDWKTQVFRENIVTKINEKILSTCSNVKIDAVQAENKIFHKAISREQYFAFIAKFILYVKEKNKNPNHSISGDGDITKEFIGQVQFKPSTTVATTPEFVYLKYSTDKRSEITDQQKFAIHKTAIATVIHSKDWQQDNSPHINRDLQLFGEFVATKLSQIDSEETLISMQQKILSLLN